MVTIRHQALFAAKYFKHSHVYGNRYRPKWIRSFSAGDPPVKKRDHEKEVNEEELAKMNPEQRIANIARSVIRSTGRSQGVHLNWMKNIAKTMNKAFSTSRYNHMRWRTRVNSLLKRLGGGTNTLSALMYMVFLGVYLSQNKKEVKNNMDLFLDAYTHHKLEIAVERKWLFQVLTPLVVLNKLSAMYIEGAHELVAGAVGFAVGEKYSTMDKMAKNNPAQLLRQGRAKMEKVKTFMHQLVQKLDLWAEYVKNNPKLDNNFINAAYADWEGIAGILDYLNTQYTKKRIQDGISFLARDAENSVGDVQGHWQGITDCLVEASTKYASNIETRESLIRIKNGINHAQNNMHFDLNTLHAVPHIIQLYRLTGYATADDVWNEKSGVRYHYQKAKHYASGHPELLPYWSELMNIWMMRMPDEAQKALQKHGQFFPNQPI